METAKSPKHLLSPLSMHHCPRQRRGAFGFRWRLAQIAKHLDRGRLSNPIGPLSTPAQKPPTDVGSADVDDLDFRDRLRCEQNCQSSQNFAAQSDLVQRG